MAKDAAYLAQYNGASLVGTAVSFLAFTYISVGLRTYVRAFLTKGFLLDDWLMLAAQVWRTQFTGQCCVDQDIWVGANHDDRQSSPCLVSSYYLVSNTVWENTTRHCLKVKKYWR